MENNQLWFLEDIDVTEVFCPLKLPKAMEEHKKSTYKKGDYIYFNNDGIKKYIYFIDSGKVLIGKNNKDGKEMTKAILERGEVFGELSLIGESVGEGDFAQALENTTVCATDADEMKSLMRERSTLQMYFLKLIGNRLLKTEQRLESMIFKDSKTRVIDYIIEMLNQKGRRVGYEYVIRELPTHQQIANYTATSRQTVTTLLNDLRAKGLITFDRKRMLIRDLDQLKSELATV